MNKVVDHFPWSFSSADIFAISIKSKEEGKLLTLNAFREMIEFERKLNEIRGNRYWGEYSRSNRKGSFQDYCNKYADPIRERIFCIVKQPRPIDFVYDYFTDWFDLTDYKTDADLIAKI